MAGLRAAAGIDKHLYAQQLLYQMRNSPLADTIAALRARGSAVIVPARPDEHRQVCSIIERFEGPAAVELAQDWLSQQPEQLSVVRAGEGVAAFALHLLCPSGSELEDRDTVVRAVLDYVASNAPARPGEVVNILRYFAGAEDYQRDQYAVLAGPVSSIIEWLTRPLAWSFIVAIDVDYWREFFDHMAFARLVEIDVDGVRHVVYGNDWRRLPVDAWFDLIHERVHSGASGPPPAGVLRPPPLDRARFGAAVKSAMLTLHRPDHLAANPLMGSALAGTSDRPAVEQLRSTIESAVAHLGDLPKGEQLRAVLDRTYVHAAPSQEAAAQVLDLPLSTYRRYLAKALEQLTDLLWTVEIGDVRLPT